MKSWSWILLILLTILIKWASWYPGWVERNYTYGVYPYITKLQRFLFGWIPFSIGDLFYAFLLLVVVLRTARFFKLLFQKKLSRGYFVAAMQQAIFFFLFVYVFFNLLWGLNYNRQGIANQLELQVKRYTADDLDSLTGALQTKLNVYAALTTEADRNSYAKKKDLFRQGKKLYDHAGRVYPFLQYDPSSVKPSIFSYAGNYLGFQGYYNPFSGEAQVNTTVPRFIEPFVTAHEIAHQLGYAKENEANFVAYLACKNFDESAVFKYSLYFDMYHYAISEMARRDTATANAFNRNLHPQVKKDMNELQRFYRSYKNPIEPIISWGYGHFLKANNQPAGKLTYNEVIAWLIAYYKKFGLEKI
jgi:hypothetical protein